MNSYLFDGTGIDQASQDASDFMEKYKVDRKGILRFRLMLEEILLKYREHFGEQANFSLRCVKYFKRLRIELSVMGEQLDPFENDEDEGNVLRRLMANIGVMPVWQYKNGRNIVVFMPLKEPYSQTTKLLEMIVAAVVLGGLCQLLPVEFGSFLSIQIVTPVTDTFMKLLSAVSGPLIFLCILGGIRDMGDMETLGKIGKRALSIFLKAGIVIGVFDLLAMLPFFGMQSGGGNSIDLSALIGMLLDIIPDNFFTPFVEGNPMQIIFVAIVGGVTLLILGNKVSNVSALVAQLTDIVNVITEGITSLLYVLVFCVIFGMILDGSFSVVLQSYRMVLIIILLNALLLPLTLIYTVVRRKVSPAVLVKKSLPTFLISLATASSSAAFADSIDTCEKRFGIDKKLTNFGMPLAQLLVAPGHVAMYLGISLSLAQSYHVSSSPGWLVIALIGSFILSIATPPVVGGTLIALNVLFVQLGIPAEAVGLAAAVSILLDFFATAVNLFCRYGLLIDLGARLSMLDESVLQRKE